MIKDSLITLRAPELADVDKIYLWENSPALREVIASGAPVSRYNVWEYVRNYDADPFSAKQLRLVIQLNETGESIGCIDLYDFVPHDQRAGIGIFVEETHRNQGIGQRALALLEEYATKELAVHQLWVHVATDNLQSAALFRGAGYKTGGRLRSWIRRDGRFVDVIFYQKLFQ